ncbi:hypothetical protein ACGRHY_13820 [Streptomyces sp. HK10]|uniref:DUF7848 domain-containing protein n=1 Tax=Streptomyces sp. HK10 TaxID=3373255 RepID=UPI0037493B7B
MMFRRLRAEPDTAGWTGEPDTAPDAPPATYRMACDECGAASHTGVEFGTALDRQLHHAARHPAHRAYTQTVTRPWRARPRP